MSKRTDSGKSPQRRGGKISPAGKQIVINCEEDIVKRDGKGVVINHEEQYSVKKDRKRK